MSQYIKFYGDKTRPKDMVKNEVKQFLRYLAEKILHSNSKIGIESIDILIQTGQ